MTAFDTVTDLDASVMFSNPYPHYAELRREQPISRARVKTLVRGTAYMLTRFDDVSMLYSDSRFSSDMVKHSGAAKFRFLMPPVMKLLTDSMVFKDDPDHKRLRTLVHKAFTPKTVAALSDDISGIVDATLNVLAAKGDIDLVADFAVQVPLAVIATMMGVADTDRDNFHQWTTRLVDATTSGPLALLTSLPTANRLVGLFADLAEHARLSPDDRLISALVQAQEDDGDRLSDREILAMTFLLLLAGHDTTTNLIGSSVLALLQHPDQLAMVRADPEVLNNGIEELLRYTSPVPFGATRYALEDIRIGDTLIPAGSQVLGMIISANRDESAFPDPDVLDLTRTPNKHLAFSLGPHYCLGHQLARMEGRIALTGLLRRFEQLDVTVPVDQLRYKPSASLRGLTSIPMRVS